MTEQEASQSSQKRKPGFRANLSLYFSEYSENTSIHGVRYLGEIKRVILERLFWLVIISISFYLCTYLIVETYQKWKGSPVIVSFAKSPTPVWKVPFPAVTICPETKAMQRKYNFTEAFHKYKEERVNMTAEELRHFQELSLVCDSQLESDGAKTVEYDAIRFLSEVAPTFYGDLWHCKWVNENRSCDTLLVNTLTEEGVCFTFNMLNREELLTDVVYHNEEFWEHDMYTQGWTLEEGYREEEEVETFPRRAIAAGQKACFSLLMTLYEPDLDYLCKGAVQGFKILLHSPVEIPRVSQRYFRAPLNQEVIVSIKPDMMTTSENLRGYPSDSRHCFFADERHLKYFKVYTQRNCEVECLTNRSLEFCGCAAYYMPHDDAALICGPGSSSCIKKAQAEMISIEAEIGIQGVKENDVNKQRCNCLPACTSLNYNAETSQADFDWPKVFEAFKVNETEFPGIAMTRVTFFFKEQQFITSERNELYGLVDFMANCGGLLGLFFGFSFLSVLEILYFLTLRIVCNVVLYNRRYWSGSAKLME